MLKKQRSSLMATWVTLSVAGGHVCLNDRFNRGNTLILSLFLAIAQFFAKLKRKNKCSCEISDSQCMFNSRCKEFIFECETNPLNHVHQKVLYKTAERASKSHSKISSGPVFSPSTEIRERTAHPLYKPSWNVIRKCFSTLSVASS